MRRSALPLLNRLSHAVPLLVCSLLAASLAVAACGNDIEARRDTSPSDDTSSQGDSPQNDTLGLDGADLAEDTVSSGKAPGDFARCASDADCSNGSCMQRVCIADPTAFGHITVDADGVTLYEDVPPELGCFTTAGRTDPNEGVTPATPDQTATVWGDIERFGPGPSTFDICVTFYDHERLLQWLDHSDCNDLPAGQERIDCFRADPCRCEALAGAEQNDCFRSIGMCDKLAGTDKNACVATLPGGKPIVYAYGKSICEDGNGNPVDCYDDTIARKYLFRIAGVPVNRNLAVKTSGLEMRWVDTLEFGAFVPWSRVKHDVTDPVTGDSNTYKFQANVIAGGAWDSIPSTAGLSYPIDKKVAGAIAGRLQDCGLEGRSAAVDPAQPLLDNSQAIYHATVGFAQEPDKLSYFNGNPDDTLPSPNRVDANVLAVYAALNVPYGKNRVASRVDLATAPTNADCVGNGSGGVSCTAGARDIFVLPHSVVITTFEQGWVEVE